MPTAKSREEFLKLARERFKQAQKAEKEQRERELEDLRFYAGDQWPEDIKNSRAGQNAQNGMPPVPARPCITLVGNTREPVRQVLNQERQADMGIEIIPADDFGDLTGPIDDTEIQLREGLVRRIQRESIATDARTWAFARSTIAGRGFYAVMTRYAKGKTGDQEIYVHRFQNQACVTLDPAHEQPDGSDVDWEFWGTDYRWGDYVAEFPKRNGKKNELCEANDDEFRALGDAKPGWFTGEGETRMVRVMDYVYTVRKTRELVTLVSPDGQALRFEWADEVEGAKAIPELVAELDGWTEKPDSRRDVVEKSIKWAKLDGSDEDVLDETDWPGPDMPIIKVLGEELQPYDDKRRVEGMVRAMREPQRGLNYMVSRWVEVVGLAPLTPAMIEEGTIEGYEAWWEAANTRTLPYLPYKKTDLSGQPANMPTVPPARTPPIEPLAMSVQMFKEAVQDSSGYHGPSLGKVDPSVKSGRAIKALQEQASQGSNHYLDNLQRSMRYEAQVINNLLFPIYGRPGRIARILNGENQPESVLLHQPMIVQNGRPVPANGHEDAKTYTLTKDAKFNVALKISKNYDTRRQQEMELVGGVIERDPNMMGVVGDLWFENMDGPGHKQMADRMKVMLAPPVQAYLQSKQQGQDPQMASALAQKDQQIQAMQAELQKSAKPTAVEELKQAGETERHKMALLFDNKKLEVESEVKLAVAELNALAKQMQQTLGLFAAERARLGVSSEADAARSHELGMAAMSQAGSADAAAAQRAHDAEQAEATRAHATAESESARQAAAEQAAMQGQA